MNKTYTYNNWQLLALFLLLLTTGGVAGYSKGMQSSDQDSIITQLRRELGYEEEYNRVVTDEAAAAQKRVLVLEHELATQKAWRDLEHDSEATPVVDAMVNRMMPDIYAAMCRKFRVGRFGIPTWLRPAPSPPTTMQPMAPAGDWMPMTQLPDPY